MDRETPVEFSEEEEQFLKDWLNTVSNEESAKLALERIVHHPSDRVVDFLLFTWVTHFAPKAVHTLAYQKLAQRFGNMRA